MGGYNARVTSNQPIRTAIYIDGFNLFYWLKPLPYRWVDLKALCLGAIQQPNKDNKVVAVKYFTARVSDTRYDVKKSTRQDTYINALKAHIPEFKVQYGEFRRNEKQMPRANRDGTTGPLVWVMDTEEKGSDVNLAVELVNDAWCDLYDLAIVVSNDSDLEHAVRIAKKKRMVGVLVRGDAEVHSLKRASNFMKKLTEKNLLDSLMPHEIPGTTIRIPEDWRLKEQRAGISR